jgi:hypothetical protein
MKIAAATVAGPEEELPETLRHQIGADLSLRSQVGISKK